MSRPGKSQNINPMNYELYRLLQKKRRKSFGHKRGRMSQSLVLHAGLPNPPRKSPRHQISSQKNPRPLRKASQDHSTTNRFQSVASQVANLEFSVPRNPNKAKEFSFDKENSKEIVVADNFSFSEKVHGGLKRVKRESGHHKPGGQTASGSSAKFASGMLGSICSSIMNRYNSFIQVSPAF